MDRTTSIAAAALILGVVTSGQAENVEWSSGAQTYPVRTEIRC